CLSQGDFVQARAHLEEALKIFDPECDRDAKFRFGQDSTVGAMIYLAHTEWLLGQVGRVRKLIDEAVARAVETGHVPTQSTAYYYEALLETFGGNGSGAERAAKALVEVSQEHGLPLFLAWGTLSLSWARARLG